MIGALAAVLQDGEASNVVEWFTDQAARSGAESIPTQLWPTLWHSAVALAVVVLVAVPIAGYLAHHRRAELLSAFAVSIGRAVPTVTVVGIAVIVSLRNGYGFEPWPILIALVLLGLPPVFANTYAAVRSVDAHPVAAARAMGATEAYVLRHVELPLALPVIIAGIRTAAVQIVATEPLGAFFGGEGLGAYLRQGLATRDDIEVQAGALLVAGTAVAVELLLLGLGRLVMPDGVRRAGRHRRAGRLAARRTTPVTS